MSQNEDGPLLRHISVMTSALSDVQVEAVENAHSFSTPRTQAAVYPVNMSRNFRVRIARCRGSFPE
jgi:hypothetical protein